MTIIILLAFFLQMCVLYVQYTNTDAWACFWIRKHRENFKIKGTGVIASWIRKWLWKSNLSLLSQCFPLPNQLDQTSPKFLIVVSRFPQIGSAAENLETMGSSQNFDGDIGKPSSGGHEKASVAL